MYIERGILEEYPFDGAFYTSKVDESKPLNQQVEEEVLLFETKCDIQESTSNAVGGVITGTFNVYFPFDKQKGVGVKRGDIFRGFFYGVDVVGIVDGIAPSQLGGCKVRLVDRT